MDITQHILFPEETLKTIPSSLVSLSLAIQLQCIPSHAAFSGTSGGLDKQEFSTESRQQQFGQFVHSFQFKSVSDFDVFFSDENRLLDVPPGFTERVTFEDHQAAKVGSIK